MCVPKFKYNTMTPDPSCVPDCKLLFKHDVVARSKDHPWHPCTYCSCISQKMLHSHYGGRMEEFCRPHCMSQYTVLYYGVRRWMSHYFICHRNKEGTFTPVCSLCASRSSCLFFPPSPPLLSRWGDVMFVGSRATWLRSCSVWVQSAISATCPACCSTATYILRRASRPAVTVLERPHRHHGVNCVITSVIHSMTLSAWTR